MYYHQNLIGLIEKSCFVNEKNYRIFFVIKSTSDPDLKKT